MTDRRAIPRRGPCLVLALYRSPLDRRVLSRRIPRNVRFASEPEDAAAILSAGGCACAFPEGPPAWYGSHNPESAWFRMASEAGVPVIIASVVGSYDRFPPFARRPGRGCPLKVRFYPCTAAEAEKTFYRAAEDERHRDIALRRKQKVLNAENIEEILYICPVCEELLTLRGQRNGTVECRVCGESWTFIRGKALKNNTTGKTLPLKYVEDLAADRLRTHRMKQIQFSIMMQPGGRGLLILAEDHFILAGQVKDPSAFIFSYNDVLSLGIEGRDRLNLVCRQGDKETSFRIIPPLHACLFLLHIITIRAGVSGGGALKP